MIKSEVEISGVISVQTVHILNANIVNLHLPLNEPLVFTFSFNCCISILHEILYSVVHCINFLHLMVININYLDANDCPYHFQICGKHFIFLLEILVTFFVSYSSFCNSEVTYL